MALSSKQLEILISAKDKATKVLRGVRKAFVKLKKAASKVGKGIGGVFKKLSGVLFNFKTSLVALAGVGGFGMLAKGIIDTGIEFENYRATLKTVLGSQEKANKSFEWLEKFASSTPFAINELSESFVRLAAYGIDGTKVLKTLGDAASAMGKPIMQAVEAVADAQTGEFERMKEFGIKAVQITKSNASQMSATLEDVGKTALTFTDKMGKEQAKIVDRNNRKMITSTIEAIWNEKYEGAMEERSKTLAGILSNMGDRWTSFKNKVAEKVMPLLSKRLSQLGDVMDKFFLNSGGAAEGWEKVISTAMKNVIEYVSGFGAGIIQIAHDTGMSFKDMEDDSASWQKKGREHVEFLMQKYEKFKKWIKTNGRGMWEEIKAGARDIIRVFGAVARAIDSVVRGYRALQRFGGSIANLYQSNPGMEQNRGHAGYGIDNNAVNRARPRVDLGGHFPPSVEDAINNNTYNVYTSNNRQSVDRAAESRGAMSPQFGRSTYNAGGMLPAGFGR